MRVEVCVSRAHVCGTTQQDPPFFCNHAFQKLGQHSEVLPLSVPRNTETGTTQQGHPSVTSYSYRNSDITHQGHLSVTTQLQKRTTQQGHPSVTTQLQKLGQNSPRSPFCNHAVTETGTKLSKAILPLPST